MMKIKTKGSNKAVRKLVELATSYYAEKLMCKRTINNLEININLKRNFLRDTGCEGTAIWEDENIWPKEFLIELDSSDKIRDLLITLAHEMVHVKQWAKNEMYEYCKGDEVRFNKTKFNMSDIIIGIILGKLKHLVGSWVCLFGFVKTTDLLIVKI